MSLILSQTPFHIPSRRWCMSVIVIQRSVSSLVLTSYRTKHTYLKLLKVAVQKICSSWKAMRNQTRGAYFVSIDKEKVFTCKDNCLSAQTPFHWTGKGIRGGIYPWETVSDAKVFYWQWTQPGSFQPGSWCGSRSCPIDYIRCWEWITDQAWTSLWHIQMVDSHLWQIQMIDSYLCSFGLHLASWDATSCVVPLSS